MFSEPAMRRQGLERLTTAGELKREDTQRFDGLATNLWTVTGVGEAGVKSMIACSAIRYGV